MAVDGREYVTYRAPVIIEHTGYDLSEVERRIKAERNIALLERELERLEKLQAETALFFENIYDEFGDSADFQFLMGLI